MKSHYVQIACNGGEKALHGALTLHKKDTKCKKCIKVLNSKNSVEGWGIILATGQITGLVYSSERDARSMLRRSERVTRVKVCRI